MSEITQDDRGKMRQQHGVDPRILDLGEYDVLKEYVLKLEDTVFDLVRIRANLHNFIAELQKGNQQASRLATVEAENARLRNIEMAARQVIAELPKYAILGQATTEVKLATLQALWQVLDMKPVGGS